MDEQTFRWVITGGVAIATLCILIMAVAALLLYRIVAKVQVRIDGVTERVMPIVDTVRIAAANNAPKVTAIVESVRTIIADNTPKVSQIANRVVEIAANAKDMSDVAKDQAHRFAEVGRDIADRTKAKVALVDTAVDETVEQVQHAGDNVKAAVMKPVREAGAVLAGVKAAVSTLASGRRQTVDHITQDEEMFI